MIRDLLLPIPPAMIEEVHVPSGLFGLGKNKERRLPTAIHNWLLDNPDGVEIVIRDGWPYVSFRDDAVASLFWIRWSDEITAGRRAAWQETQHSIDNAELEIERIESNLERMQDWPDAEPDPAEAASIRVNLQEMANTRSVWMARKASWTADLELWS